jgi:energy-coupling factor transporter ATP-binding protein EcfA2
MPEPEPHLIDREIGLIRDLSRLSAERSEAEVQTAGDFLKADRTADRTFQAAREQLAARRAAEETAARQAHEQARQAAIDQFHQALAAAQAQLEQARKEIEAQIRSQKEAADKERDEVRWKADAMLDAAVAAARKCFDEFERGYKAEQDGIAARAEDARYLIDRFRSWAPPAEDRVPMPEPIPGQSLNALRTARETLEEAILRLDGLGLAKFVRDGGGILIAVALALVLAVVGGFGLNGTVGAAVGGLVGAVLGGIVVWQLNARGRRQVEPPYRDVVRALTIAEALGPRCLPLEQALVNKARAEAEARAKEEIRLLDREHARRTATIEQTHASAIAEAQALYDQTLTGLPARRDAALKAADDALDARLGEWQRKVEATTKQIHETYQAQKEAAQRRRDERWSALATAWRQGMEQVLREVDFVQSTCATLFPDWNRADWEHHPVPSRVPPALRIGTLAIDRGTLPGSLPTDERLKIGPDSLSLPALIPFPQRGSLLIRAGDEGREHAAEVLQATMLRLLTSLPPAKVRFTILDPVGLGRHFAAFMHLADFDEKLVASRIWSEAPHIEKKLADLTEHMENVIQKYLRNEYETIEDYNAQAGEVAEPYQVLVVADFPANFSDNAARRLASIATSGVRCGVLTLISVDTRQPLPSGFDIKDLEKHATQLAWKNGRFVWNHAELGLYPLTLDQPPSTERFTQILHVVGARAREAGKVEVPFEVIAPAADRHWTWDSRPGIDVPLGRAGATRLQHLRLGAGTSQHVLIAGRTGSGKSTLLHALITNLALRYSPDEVELYLIDFKKGVEFQTYATHALPHARVVAIESEREFGLSVLQRLDAELKLRGDRFRAAGTQDLAAYRDATREPCPRILLIVDEFQEFFVEDDKLAQEASLLLDRLVRQGRAFGIHVHLGSQTLGGAYSLARSTLSQMAVRIALQCSESDAHLILSEENSAARLLSRPGEAIYNDANGLIEGNHPFQVVWLPESRREEYLQRIAELDQARRQGGLPRPMIVFEGTAPANLDKNPALSALLAAATWPDPTPSPTAWLGEAVAIKDPTSAVFRRQGGANLLIVGQQEEAALGILTAALIGLAARHAPDSARFLVLDGTPADSPRVGTFAHLRQVFPHVLRVGGVRDAAAIVDEVARIVASRQESDDPSNVFLIVHDLQRFRDLRKAEDDFGFSSMGSDEPPSPAKQLGTILREGPPLGVHVLTWCDSLNNLQRAFDRQSLREFEQRVLFQMSTNDSSNLIDSPAAGRLGPYRALYASEELGVLEKFRPYSVPTPEWLDRLRERLQGRPSPELGSSPATTGAPAHLDPSDAP